MNSIPKVYVVDDEFVIRDSLAMLVASDGLDCQTFCSGAEFLDDCSQDSRGCLVLDVRMPEMDGLEVQRRLNADNVRIPIIMLTGHADVSLAVMSLKAGAVDFVEKPFDPQDLLNRIRAALQRDVERQKRRDELRAAAARLATLSAREREVLELLVDGKSTKQIAYELDVSFNTVRNQRSSILAKLNADTIVDVVRVVTELRSE